MSRHNHKATDWQRLLKDQIEQHSALLFRLAYGVLHDADQSEDACQQALLQAWRRRQDVRNGEAVRGWLARIVINESFAILRRRRTENRVLRDQAPRGATPADPAESVALRDLVVAALAELDEPIRSVVVLRTMQGMSGGEVGQMLEMSLSEVSRRLHQGLDRLRNFISAQQG